MMKKHYSFPSIDQFRTVVKHVNDRCTYHNVAKPTLGFMGTVKLHGTNAGVVVTPAGEVYAQSREAIITPDSDNAGFARFVEENKAAFKSLARSALQVAQHDVVLYGEWCGGNIQKGVAINQLEKRFVLFGFKEAIDETTSAWFSPAKLANIKFDWNDKITSIYNFPTWLVNIDFNHPEQIQNELVDLTMAVEAECPVGKAYGVAGVGEGIVWRCIDHCTGITTDDLIFKVKGEKHSVTKTKTLAPVDVEKFNAIAQLAEAVTTNARLEQGLEYVKALYPGVDVLEMRYVPDFLKWVGQDVVKEESDTIAASGFDVKEVTKSVNNQARFWFKQKVDNFA